MKRMSGCVVLCATLPVDSQLKPWWPTAIQTAEQMLCWDTGNASPSAGIPAVLDRISYCGMPPHAVEGFEQKEKSRCGTAAHGSTALSLWKHISHLKATDGWRLHLSGTLAEQTHIFLSASSVRQKILFPLSSSCYLSTKSKSRIYTIMVCTPVRLKC